jgi:phosphopantetheine adenylyltransferase
MINIQDQIKRNEAVKALLQKAIATNDAEVNLRASIVKELNEEYGIEPEDIDVELLVMNNELEKQSEQLETVLLDLENTVAQVEEVLA